MAVPFTAFNFRVKIEVPGMAGKPGGFLCEAAFAECSGLEMSMQIKTIKEGGNNLMPVHLCGPVTYSHLTLKRGMSADFQLWKWFNLLLERNNYGLRGSCTVEMLSSDQSRKPVATFSLVRCLPVKLRAPGLIAKDGLVAIEEMQLAYERLDQIESMKARR